MHTLKRISQAEFLERRIDPEVAFVLPHEEDFFHEYFAKQAKRQAVHGLHLNEAMSQGAETFHDNAPAEAIVSDQYTVYQTIAKLRDRWKRSLVVEYPVSEAYVTIGSLAHLSFDRAAPESYYLVGSTDGYDKQSIPTGIELASEGSPLGDAVIGKAAGEVGKLLVKNRAIELEVVDFTQVQWPIDPNVLQRFAS